MIRSPLLAVVFLAACATAPAPTTPPPQAGQAKTRHWAIGGLGLTENGKSIAVQLGVNAQEDGRKRLVSHGSAPARSTCRCCQGACR